MYDVTSKQWKTLPSMALKRDGCAAAVVDGRVFVFGGYDGKNWLDSAECFDPNTNSWKRIAGMLTKRSYCAAVTLMPVLEQQGTVHEPLSASPPRSPALEGKTTSVEPPLFHNQMTANQCGQEEHVVLQAPVPIRAIASISSSTGEMSTSSNASTSPPDSSHSPPSPEDELSMLSPPQRDTGTGSPGNSANNSSSGPLGIPRSSPNTTLESANSPPPNLNAPKPSIARSL
jgi:hypothetical protein